MRKGLGALAAAVVVVAVAAGCGSGKHSVQLDLVTQSTGGKALVLVASIDKKLASQKGVLWSYELRGIDTDSGNASFDRAALAAPDRCLGGSSCVWTIAPSKAGNYEYKVFLVDDVHQTTGGDSKAVRVSWAAPPRPRAIRLFVNGKTPPSTPLDDDNYSDFPAGPMRVEAKWATDARDTGYYVQISIANKVYARCSTGTSCRVAKRLPLPDRTEVSWTLELVTTRGKQVVGGFKVCLTGAKKQKSA